MERLIEGAILGGLIGVGVLIWQTLKQKTPANPKADEGHTTHNRD